MPSDVAKALQKRQQILNLERIKFTGSIRDNNGVEKVPAGTTLNDGELFTTLDYYVRCNWCVPG